YRADASQTLVSAFVETPYALLSPVDDGHGGRYVYRLEVEIKDSTGLVLLNDAWTNRASSGGVRPGAVAVDMIHFSLAAGQYRLRASVVDSASGRRSSTMLDLEGFRAPPLVSDLLLSPRMRLVSPTDTVPQPSEMRWGSALVTAAARLELTPLRTRAYYLLEAYAEQEAAGTLSIRLADSTGKVLIQAAPAMVRVPPGGGLLTGQMDLAGLPTGRYRMTVALALGDQSVERSADLEMAGLEQTLARDVAERNAAREGDEGYFALMPDAELDEAEAPLALIADNGELKVWDRSLSPDAKRRFLTQFWTRRDPTAGTLANEFREEFKARVEYANRTFKEPGRIALPGWKTDRGRIYVRNGPPDDTLRERQQEKAPPYEVWNYQKGKSRYYCFADRTGFGGYKLLLSNDLRESNQPNWRGIMTEAAVTSIGRFLGIDFYSPGSPDR
ncbi:MAG: GWxTD domain-containing protein, partial [Gemmatimonadales bacterium]